MIIGITGHRPNRLMGEWDGYGPLSNSIYKKIDEIVKAYTPEKMITGMALGVDTIAARVAIEHNIPLVCALPFVGQEKRWPKARQEDYWEILNHKNSKTVVVCQGSYSKDKMNIRNQYIVNNSEMMIAVWNGEPSGTKNCVDYAIEQNKKIIRINPYDLHNW